MAQILSFRTPELRDGVESGRHEGQSTSAQVILFPGVRYERWSEAAVQAAGEGGSRPARDVIELADQ